MSNPNSKIDSRANEPLGVGLTSDCFSLIIKLGKKSKQKKDSKYTDIHTNKPT